MKIHYATIEELVELGRLATARGLDLSQMMELAGWQVAVLCREIDVPLESHVTVVAGEGNNGANGLCAARHLHNFGYRVSVVMNGSRLNREGERQAELLEQMHVPQLDGLTGTGARTLSRSDVIIDAIAGYQCALPLNQPLAKIASAVNSSRATVIAVDLPTGMHADTGACDTDVISAQTTLTLALPKRAFEQPVSRETTGDVWVADIGIPRWMYDHVRPDARPPFEKSQTAGLLPLFPKSLQRL